MLSPSGSPSCHNRGKNHARFRAGLRRAIRGKGYRADETLLRRDTLSDFNDGCRDFAELRAHILQARAMAVNDAEPASVPRPRLEIRSDDLIKA
jgi:hypothetical protein